MFSLNYLLVIVFFKLVTNVLYKKKCEPHCAHLHIFTHACIKTLENVIGVPRYKRLLFT